MMPNPQSIKNQGDENNTLHPPPQASSSSSSSSSSQPNNKLVIEGNELEGFDDDIEKSSILLEWDCTMKKFDDLSKSVLSKTMRSIKLKNLQIIQLRNQNRTLISQNTVNITTF